MISKILKIWILVVFVVTGVLGTVYLAVQQNYRQSAYDPEIQMAEDTAASLNNGDSVPSFDKVRLIDISKSLAPFLIVYDSTGNIISSEAVLNGQSPKMVPGVFDWVNGHGEDRFTWQPQSDTRIAMIVVPFKSTKLSGYVVVGRSMREIERRIENLLAQVALGWSATVFGSLVLIGVLEFIFPSKKK